MSIDVRVSLECPVARSSRVAQIEGMFDLEEAKSSTFELALAVDIDARPWSVGLIVGPSGAGKTSVARQLFGDFAPVAHDHERAIVDGFPADLAIKEVSALLSAVGLASIPAWLRPRNALSNGEGFRCDVARGCRSSIARLRLRFHTQHKDSSARAVAAWLL